MLLRCWRQSPVRLLFSLVEERLELVHLHPDRRATVVVHAPSMTRLEALVEAVGMEGVAADQRGEGFHVPFVAEHAVLLGLG